MVNNILIETVRRSLGVHEPMIQPPLFISGPCVEDVINTYHCPVFIVAQKHLSIPSFYYLPIHGALQQLTGDAVASSDMSIPQYRLYYLHDWWLKARGLAYHCMDIE